MRARTEGECVGVKPKGITFNLEPGGRRVKLAIGGGGDQRVLGPSDLASKSVLLALPLRDQYRV